MWKKFFLLAAAVGAVCLLAGCEAVHQFRPAEVRKFEKEVRREYPGVKVKTTYSKNFGMMVEMEQGDGWEEEDVFGVLERLRDMVEDEEFQEKFLEAVHKFWVGDINWELGWRPEITADFTAGGGLQYRFTARYFLEGYNSGVPKEEYTYDGYKTWWGGSLGDDVSPGVRYEPGEIDGRTGRGK